MITETKTLLTHHWALDEMAAESAGQLIDAHPEQRKQLEAALLPLSEHATAARDENRRELALITRGESSKKLLLLGPCSLDEETDVTKVFDAVTTLQRTLGSSALVAMRANSAKPRTASGWKGMWYSTDEPLRRAMFDIYSEAAERHIPIVSEITETPQIAALAPFLSGAWIGARDIASTSLRGMASAFHMPIGLKTGVNGETKTTEQALQAARSNSDITGSGVDLTRLAATAEHPGIALHPVPVQSGNENLFVIARGNSSGEHTKAAGLRHLGETCVMGARSDAVTVVDVSHDLVNAFGSNRADPNRSRITINGLLTALESGDISAGNTIAGILAEIGPTTGRTDPNWLLNKESIEFLHGSMERLARIGQYA